MNIFANSYSEHRDSPNDAKEIIGMLVAHHEFPVEAGDPMLAPIAVILSAARGASR
jgi:hypothetical protein